MMDQTSLVNQRAIRIARVNFHEKWGILLQTLWFNRTNLYASIAPNGGVCFFFPATMGVAAVILLADGLIRSSLWSTPQLFQAIAVMPFTAVGTIGILAWFLNRLSLRHYVQYLAWGLLLAVAVNSLAWALVWLHVTHPVGADLGVSSICVAHDPTNNSGPCRSGGR